MKVLLPPILEEICGVGRQFAFPFSALKFFFESVNVFRISLFQAGLYKVSFRIIPSIFLPLRLSI